MEVLPALVLLTTLVSCAGFGSIGPFSVKGYAWVIVFAASVLHYLGQGFRSTFPMAIWLPWLLYTAAGLLSADAPNALQRTVLLVCPCVVGASLACLPVRDGAVRAFMQGCRVLVGALAFLALLRTGVLATGRLPTVTGLAGESMTATALATLFAAEFASGVRGAIWFWFLAFVLPVIAVVRGVILATLVTLPATYAPASHRLRLGIILLVAVLGIAVFQSERVQRKMFQSGSGQLADLRLDNPDLQTSGRALTWELMLEQARTKPWFGHGANANEAFILETFGVTGQPHNDWVRLFFDYGYVGAALFAVTLAAQSLHAFAAARRAAGRRRIFLYAGASAFVPFAMIMVTDNVVLYAGFFGNIHFALLGLGYSARAQDAPTADNAH
jgi:O-antigen ligase